MLDEIFSPSSIAIIGASRHSKKVGHEVLKNIIKSGYNGKIFPINPEAKSILGLKCYKTILNIKEKIDLGVVTVPAKLVPMIAEDASKNGIKALIIISSGFKETGSDGSKLENEVLGICKKNKIRVIGPNCLGIINTHVPLNASFASRMPYKGNITFITQSGALGTAILDWSLKRGIGFDKFVSLGNKSDVDENDLLLALLDDINTKVILIYLEGINKGDLFIEITRKVSHKKPIIILKSGISEKGVRAVSSHTGSMAGSDLAFDVAFKKVGVIRAETIEELFDLAQIFSTQPIPKGENIAIITNAGGPGIIATDACEKYKVNMADMDSEIVEELRQKLPKEAGFFNPVDILGDALSERYKFALETILKSKNVNNVLTILTPQAVTEPVETANILVKLREVFSTKPLVTSFIGGKKVEKAINILERANIPNYDFPERAIKSFSSLIGYGKYLTISEIEEIEKFDVDRNKVEEILNKTKSERRVIVRTTEATEISKAYGIPAPSIELATTSENAVNIAENIGYPVVLKIESPQILHKTDIGGIKLNVQSSDEVRKSFFEIIGRAHFFYPDANILGITVQKMVKEGNEMIIGMNRDLTFGPLIMFGLGGIYVNFLKDVSFRLAPLNKNSVIEMIKETKAYSIIRGVRGEKNLDLESIINVILRLSQLVTDFNELIEIDINPLVVYEEGKGCIALDIKMTIDIKG